MSYGLVTSVHHTFLSSSSPHKAPPPTKSPPFPVFFGVFCCCCSHCFALYFISSWAQPWAARSVVLSSGAWLPWWLQHRRQWISFSPPVFLAGHQFPYVGAPLPSMTEYLDAQSENQRDSSRTPRCRAPLNGPESCGPKHFCLCIHPQNNYRAFPAEWTLTWEFGGVKILNRAGMSPALYFFSHILLQKSRV